MVDIESGRVVDMVYTRESAEVAEWLKTYPNIRVVSRDGSTLYAKAISTAHPDAIQVSDRFHLVKGLTEAAGQYIRRIIASRIRVESDTGSQSGGYWNKPLLRGTDLPERLHNATTEKRAIAIEKVRELAAQGFDLNRITKETGHCRKIIKRYLDEGFSAEYREYGVNRASKLKAYTATIDEMLAKQKKFREIEATIRSLGYTGAASTIRMYASRERRHNQTAHDEAVTNTEVIERKWLLKLLYNPIEKAKGITESQLGKVLSDYPALAAIYNVVRTFKEIMFGKRVGDLEVWIESAKALGMEEINSFVNGMSRDLEAIKNAIRFEYNNGLAEGSINKIKLYKRIMYGRNSFELLRCIVKPLEKSTGEHVAKNRNQAVFCAVFS